MVYFPNVDFETKIVHFGCVVNETEVTRKVKITNSGPLHVDYKWSFKLDEAAKNALVVVESLEADQEPEENLSERNEEAEVAKEQEIETQAQVRECHIFLQDVKYFLK